MSQKCVHKGCGKRFDDAEEECVYHPGPPIFHEGQKGWKCCRPRVLTFDEFLTINPCTTGKHSTVDDSPAPTPEPQNPAQDEPPPGPTAKPVPVPKPPVDPQLAQPTAPAAPISLPAESDSDDPSKPVAPNTTCKRRACNATSSSSTASSREGEECVHHPGHPIFHEGTKGWTCCKKRVLEFDEFLGIEGCKRKNRHLFVGKAVDGESKEELQSLRHDFYQTPTTVIASLFLKKIDRAKACVHFSEPSTVHLELFTTDNKSYQADMPLFGTLDAAKSTFKIMSTKLELTIAKADQQSWPTLRSDEQRPNGIIQVGQAARA